MITRASTLLAFLSVVIAVSSISPRAAAVDDAQARQLFDRQFAQKRRAVLATRTREDDAALAREILAGAQVTRGGPETVTVYFYEQAYEMGKRDPRGFRAAVDALSSLARLQPHRTLEMQERMLELYEVAFRSSRGPSGTAKARYHRAGAATADLMAEIADARSEFGDTRRALLLYRKAYTIAKQVDAPQTDALRQKMETAGKRAVIAARIKRYEEQLKSNPNDTAAARALIDLYLVALDDPDGAAHYAGQLKGDDKATMIRAATEPLGKLDAAAELSLGKWYVELAKTAEADHRPPLLVRARMYFDHVSDRVAGVTDAQRTEARLAGAVVNQRLADMQINTATADQLVAQRKRFLGVFEAPKEPTPVASTEPAKPAVPSPQPAPTRPATPPATTTPATPAPAPSDASEDADSDAFKPVFKRKQQRYKLPSDYWEDRKSIFDFGND